jgi:hypothetical protein
MKNMNYAVVQSHVSPVVVANFTTYETAYKFCQTGWDYRIVATKTAMTVGAVISKADLVDYW